MNISDVKVRLTEKDVLSIIDENLKIDEIKIKHIDVSQCIKVEGLLVKGIKLNFVITLDIIDIENNTLKLKILNLKLGILPISIKLVGFLLKKLLSKLSKIGINFNKNNLNIDFNLLCNYIPFVEFKLSHITVLKGGLEVEVENLVYKEDKQALSLEEVKEQIASSKTEEKIEKIGDSSQKMFEIQKIQDGYSEFRNDIKTKIPEKYEEISEILLVLPDVAALLYRLMKDKRVSLKTKVMIGTVLTYLALPNDFIPDFIPILGKGDDIGIGFIMLDKIIEGLPKNIILENWQGSYDIVEKVAQIRVLIVDTIGKNNAMKIALGTVVFIKKKKK